MLKQMKKGSQLKQTCRYGFNMSVSYVGETQGNGNSNGNCYRQ